MYSERLAALRSHLSEGGLKGFLVPEGDAYQSEYLAPHDRRITWLTGFTGSAGFVVVLLDRAALFVDGRYTEQARREVDQGIFECLPLDQLYEWVENHVSPEDPVGFDPQLFTHTTAEAWRARVNLTTVRQNPIDLVWTDQPPAPTTPAQLHPLIYAGQSVRAKIEALRDILTKKNADAALLTDAESVNWLLNIRGRDLAMTPVVLAHALAFKKGEVTLLLDPARVPLEVKNALAAEGVTIAPTWPDLQDQKVLFAPATCPVALVQALETAGAKGVPHPNPCLHPKACKNAIEAAGARAAHVRDGVALTTFLAWLEAHALAQDEITAAAHLDKLRATQPLYVSPSFPTISALDANAALPHYRTTPETNRTFQDPCLYLVDSGGQYLDGTTDVTRTVTIGTPTDAQVSHFTRVLQGHIALARCRFPRGTTGGQLDVLARAPLWEIGCDYHHGTGHGVGSFLNVHEGPQRISRGVSGATLEPGMILSNEPGYYEPGLYGIRIENLVMVVEDTGPTDREPMLAFETLTLAPLDPQLVNPQMLSWAEKAWLSAYHQRVLETLRPHLTADVVTWLEGIVAVWDSYTA